MLEIKKEKQAVLIKYTTYSTHPTGFFGSDTCLIKMI